MSNAGPGLSPNQQSSVGKVSSTNQHGEKVAVNYRTGSPADGRDTARSQVPSGMIKTGAPISMGRGVTNETLFNTRQPHAAGRALGTPGKLTGK